jgi:CPA2 family monovalent cation:H+ antiporter-2
VHDSEAARLHSILLPRGAVRSDARSANSRLGELGVEVTAVRRRNIRALEPSAEISLSAGDVVVLLGRPEGLSAAEERCCRG